MSCFCCAFAFFFRVAFAFACFCLLARSLACLLVSVCVCVCVRFFGLIDFKIGRQLPFGPLKTKQNFFFALKPSPPQKGNFLGILITPEPFDGFSSKFQITCLILIRNFWKKILATPRSPG